MRGKPLSAPREAGRSTVRASRRERPEERETRAEPALREVVERPANLTACERFAWDTHPRPEEWGARSQVVENCNLARR